MWGRKRMREVFHYQRLRLFHVEYRKWTHEGMRENKGPRVWSPRGRRVNFVSVSIHFLYVSAALLPCSKQDEEEISASILLQQCRALTFMCVNLWVRTWFPLFLPSNIPICSLFISYLIVYLIDVRLWGSILQPTKGGLLVSSIFSGANVSFSLKCTVLMRKIFAPSTTTA